MSVQYQGIPSALDRDRGVYRTPPTPLDIQLERSRTSVPVPTADAYNAVLHVEHSTSLFIWQVGRGMSNALATLQCVPIGAYMNMAE
jgi:hypothetical protein